MKKLLKSLACFAAAALVGSSALANYGWYNTSIDIGGIRSDYSTWSQGHGAPDTDLGTLSSLTVTGVKMCVWDDSNDRGGANMFFRLYDDDSQIGQDIDLWLGGATRISGDHDFSVTYTGTIDLATEFGTQLVEGKTYYLTMWAKTYGDAGDHWYSGEYSENFHTKFVYSAPKTYTLVESADDLVVGADYLVVSTVDGAASAMKNEANGTAIGLLGLADAAIDGNTISASSDAIVWQLKSGTALGQRVWFNAAADVYAAAPDSAGDNAQLLADGTDDLAQWTIDTSALPAVQIDSVSYAGRYLQRDATAANAWFAAYDSAQATPSLYRADATEVQTVTFDPNGGTYMEEKLTMKYAMGREYWGIWKPTRTGYKFKGWFDSDTGEPIQNNMTVEGPLTRSAYAKWARCQTVVFHANGGSYDKASAVCAGVYTGLTTPTRDGYKFKGWFDAETGGTLIKNGDPLVDGDTIDLYAHWGQYQTVVFHANGGSYDKDSLVCAGIYKGLTMPSRDGYKFKGWFDAETGGTMVQNGQAVEGGDTRDLYAHWGRYQTVIFHANGGSYDKDSLVCAGVYKGLTRPTWNGHKFRGWFDAETGGTMVQNGQAVEGGDSRDLYAHWTETGLAISGFSMSFRSRAAARGTSEVTDTITASVLGLTQASSYKDFSGISVSTPAVYAGNATLSDAAHNSTLQLRASSSSQAKCGIVTTTSGGTAKKVKPVWNTTTTSGRVLDVYGQNTAYSGASDLYGSNPGTKIGSITNGTTTELEITGDYTFIGVKSSSGAQYLDSIEITWLVTTPDPTTPTVILQASAEEVYVGEEVTFQATATNFTGDVEWVWYVGENSVSETSSTFTWTPTTTNTYTIKAYAADLDNDQEAEASVTVTVNPQTLTLQATATTVEAGDQVTITGTPVGFSGDVTWTWTVNDVEDATATTATYVLNTTTVGSYVVEAMANYGDLQLAVSDPLTITANEPTVKYPITIDPDILQYATVTTMPAGEATENANVTVNVIPNAGYVLDVIKVNGSEITGNTFNMPAAAVTVSATFTAIPTYTLVEDAADLVVGADYLIVAVSGNYTNALLNTTNGNRIAVSNVVINGKTIATDSDAIVWQLKSGTALGYRELYNAAGNVYAATKNNDNNGQVIADGTDDLAQWTIDTSDMSAVKIRSTTYTNRFLQRNNNGLYFATYTGSQATPRFYRADSTVVQTVTFDPNGGTYMEEKLTMKYAMGREYWGIWKPSRTGYKFKGWFDSDTGAPIQNNMTVEGPLTRSAYAKWARCQTVIFHANGGSYDKDSVVCAGVYTGLTTPTRDGYKFKGWYDAETGGTLVKNGDPLVDGDSRDLYARWAQIQTVVFHANGGSYAKDSVVCAGIYTGLTMPSRDGYKFKGWFDAETGGTLVQNGDPLVGGASRDLYAHWGRYQTVIFHANGGSYDKDSLVCAGVYKGLTRPTWNGHKFRGWFDAETGGTMVQNGQAVEGGDSRDLYAHWTETGLSISGFGLKSAPRGARDSRSDGEQVAVFTFVAVAGVPYQIEWTSSLTGEWTVVKSWIAEDDGDTTVEFSIPASSIGFFRLSAPQGED